MLAVLIYFTWQETSNSHALDPDMVVDPVLGAPNAPIVITQYSDFGCPSCRAWHQAGIRDRIMAEYGDQVSFAWKDFAVISLQSPRASQGAHCAGVQGAFWDYHDLVYEQHAGIGEEVIRNYAVALNLDMTQFDQCMDLAMMERKVRTNIDEARRIGLRGTPGFAINGRPLPAPPSYEQLVRLIEAELN
jgi:protein-disulfide isomerase